MNFYIVEIDTLCYFVTILFTYFIKKKLDRYVYFLIYTISKYK